MAFLARAADPGAPAAELTRLAAGIADWEEVVAGAEAQGVLPLVQRWAAASAPAFVPAPVQAELRRRAQVQVMQSLLLAGEMLALVRRLEGAGIPALALKGPALAVRAYGALGLRPQMDVDLLVRSRDVDRALALLAAEGYRRAYPLSAGQDAAFRAVEYHHSLVGESGTSVELHWGIIKRQFGLRAREELWWAGAQSVPLGGGEVRTLANEVLLVYLAIHGAKHEWPHLRWIGDIAAVSRLQPLDWGLVRRVSAELGALRMTRLALALAMEVAGASMPAEAAAMAREDAAVPALVAAVRPRLGSGEPAGFVASTRFQLAVRERWRDRVAFAVRHAVTPNVDDLRTAEVASGWRWVYWVLRPVRLGRK
ncbi:MAG TPA: nucleotidyltransferase family protein, partial [Gemmatimonadaceae bacterium]|nr:nucleotidyltransferase family protein [Gemmatimonadaceae bacterium]